jgi:cytoskeletal protein CcmA (bactofilin family)
MLGLGKKSEKQLWNAFFASSVEIEGSLRFTGLLNIDGRLKGAIIAKGMLVTGTSAHVEGDIYVENLVLSGSVIGNIHATGEVHLNQTAVVKGNINYHTLSIVPGAVHEGNSHFFSEEERVELTERIQAEIASIERTEGGAEEKKPKKKAGREEKEPQVGPREPAEAVLTSDEPLDLDGKAAMSSESAVRQLNMLNDSAS